MGEKDEDLKGERLCEEPGKDDSKPHLEMEINHVAEKTGEGEVRTRGVKRRK